MTDEQFFEIKDLIQISCDLLLQSDFLINFPDWNNSWYFVNDHILNACEKLEYIFETCNNIY